MHLLAVDRAAEFEIVPVAELVRGDQPRAGRPEAGQRLAETELRRRAGRLLHPLGQVLADGQPGHVFPGRRFRDVAGPLADDDDQLDLPVGVPALGQLHLGDRAGQARLPLGEHDRGRVRHREPGLGGVLGVVQADGEDLPGRGRRRSEVFHGERFGGGVVGTGGPGLELRPPVVDGLRVRSEPATAGPFDVDRTVLGDQDQPAGEIGDAH
ncbi:hypothetical protein GCM10027610_062870 [Dactylosporangium cerinum]